MSSQHYKKRNTGVKFGKHYTYIFCSVLLIQNLNNKESNVSCPNQFFPFPLIHALLSYFRMKNTNAKVAPSTYTSVREKHLQVPELYQYQKFPGMLSIHDYYQLSLVDRCCGLQAPNIKSLKFVLMNRMVCTLRNQKVIVQPLCQITKKID